MGKKRKKWGEMSADEKYGGSPGKEGKEMGNEDV